MKIREGDDQEKDNKLTGAMKKFGDFKKIFNETIIDMHARFIKVVGEIRGLVKELP